jgi:hypothetical protein
MSLNPGGASSYGWNYSKQDQEGFSLELYGTIVSLQEVQAREFNPNTRQPGRPRFWPDGNPVMNIRVGFAVPDGTLKSVTFMKAGKKQVSGKKPSLHMQLYKLTNGNMMELIGKTVHIWTWPANPNNGQVWCQGNPRMFGVEEIKDAHYELASALPDEFKVPELLCNDAASGGQPVPPSPNQMHQPNVMPMNGGYYAAPVAQPQYQQPQYPQPQYQQPQQYQGAAAPAPQQMAPMQAPQQQAAPVIQTMPPQNMAAPMPQGMDPAVAQAMQAVGAVNVQPVQGAGDPTGGIYDHDIPF